MNESHKLGIKKNRLNRLERRLSDKDLPTDQRSRISDRLAELKKELADK